MIGDAIEMYACPDVTKLRIFVFRILPSPLSSTIPIIIHIKSVRYAIHLLRDNYQYRRKLHIVTVFK